MLTLYIPSTKKTVDRTIWKGVQSPKLFGNKLRFCVCVCALAYMHERAKCRACKSVHAWACNCEVSATCCTWETLLQAMFTCMVTKGLCKNFCPAAIYACRPCPHARMVTKGVHIVSALQHTFFAAVQCIAYRYTALSCDGKNDIKRQRRSALGWSHSATTDKTTSKDNVRSRITFRYDGKNDIKRQRLFSDAKYMHL